MLSCVLWGMGKVFFQSINVMKYHELCGGLKVVGVTSNKAAFKETVNWPVVNKEELTHVEFDLLIVMAEKDFVNIKKEAIDMGIAKEKIISYRALNVPQIDFKSYITLLKNPVSIFANNCWGGMTYHSLGLQFSSPFVNLFLSDEDYVKFLQDPQYYIEKKLIWKEEGYNKDLGIHYPICTCGDIVLYFNHYKSFELADKSWEERKRRINWNNLFIMMYTENVSIAERFSELPYLKKICFVPFETAKNSLCFVDFIKNKKMEGLPFYAIVNGMASGTYAYYDMVELLCYGRIKKLSGI